MVWTLDGFLFRYNGYDFTSFSITSSNIVLSGTGISALSELPDGSIVVGTECAGLWILDRFTETFTVYRTDQNNNQSISNNCILDIFKDSDSTFWIGTRDGANIFNPVLQTFTRIYPLNPKNDINAISGFTQDETGIIWMFCAGTNKFVSYNKETEHVTEHVYLKDFTKDIKWRGGKILYYDNKIWLATKFNGLFYYDITLNKTFQYSLKNTHIKDVTEIHLVHHDSQTYLWVGTDGGGIRIIHPQTLEQQVVMHTATIGALSGNGIISMYVDDEQNVWIGNYASGIDIYIKRKNIFTTYTAHSNKPHQLSSKSVLSITKLHNDLLLIGTDGGGFQLFDTKNNTIIKTVTYPQVIKSAYVLQNGIIAIGTWSEGLFLFSPQFTLLKHYSSTKPSTPEMRITNVWTIVQDTTGAVWLGSLGTGLDVYFPDKDVFLYDILQVHKKGEPNNIIKLFCDSKHRIWVCHEFHGVFVFDSGNFNEYKEICFDTKSHNPQIIHDIHEDEKGQLWFASRSGKIFLLQDFETQTFQEIPLQIKENTVANAIVNDAYGNVWITSNLGVYVYNLETNTTKFFNSKDGLQEGTFNWSSILKDADGTIYFGGINGLSFVNPAKLKSKTPPKKTIIQSIQIFDKKIQLHEQTHAATYITKPVYLTDTIVLQHFDNVIHIEFAALDFISADAIKYQYKLQGFNKTWFNADENQRIATYTNLSDGTYTFMVRTMNTDGSWQNNQTQLTIIVLPPWWKTWWFKTINIVSILTIVILIYVLKTRSIRKRNVYLQKLVEEKTKELALTNKELFTKKEAVIAQNTLLVQQSENLQTANNELTKTNKTKDKLFSIIAHDLKNPFSGLLGFTKILYADFNKIDDSDKFHYTHLVHESAQSIYSLLEQLLQWSKTQTSNISVAKTHFYLDELMQKLEELFKTDIAHKQILVQKTIVESTVIHADKTMIETALRNVLHNSIKFTPELGNIEIKNTVSDTHVEITITDSGVGMPQNIIHNLNNSLEIESTYGTHNEKGSGLGLMICKEFISLNNGTLYIQSAPNKGTTVTITLPIGDKKLVDTSLVKETIIQQYQKNKNSAITIHSDNEHVLLVEDNEAIRENLKKDLSPYFKVSTAQNGVEGLEFAKTHIPDIIVSDIQMPKMNGIDMCNALQKHEATAHIPIILLTAISIETSYIEGLEAGADDYIVKPFNSTYLAARIVNLLKTRARLQKKYELPGSIWELTEKPETYDEELLVRFKELLLQNFSNPEYSVEQLASDAGMSRAKLYRKIKLLLNISPIDYIKQMRLSYAASLIKAGGYRISEIAYMSGFSDPNYFSSCFVKQYGKTPTEYAKI